MSKFVINGKEVTENEFWKQTDTGTIVFCDNRGLDNCIKVLTGDYSPQGWQSTRHKVNPKTVEGTNGQIFIPVDSSKENFPGLGEVKESRVCTDLKQFDQYAEDYLKRVEKCILHNLEYSNKEIQESIKNAKPYFGLKLEKEAVVEPIGTKLQEESVSGTRLVSETCGVKHSEGKTPMELDFDFIKQMAERMASNKSNGKYKPFNWKSPIDIRSLKDAVMRHMIEIMEGRYEDDGREYGHIEAAATGLMMINYQLKNQ